MTLVRFLLLHVLRRKPREVPPREAGPEYWPWRGADYQALLKANRDFLRGAGDGVA